MPVRICEVHGSLPCDGYLCTPYAHRPHYNHWAHVNIRGNDGLRCPLCQSCQYHCDCRRCRFDGELSRSTCGYCGQCPDHDTCRNCIDCGDRIPRQRAFCVTCNTCGDCCTCGTNDQTYVYPHAGTPVFHAPTDDQLVRNPSRRYAALEVEIASTASGYAPYLERTLDRWGAALVHDSSIQRGNFEREINTAPAAGDLLIDQISEIADALERDGATANKSCGVHCHVDCRDFTFYDMRRLILLYEQIEDALFAMVPRTRRTSRWCHPCGKRYGDAIRDGRMPTDDNAKKAIVANLYDVEMAGNEKDDDRRVRRAIRSAKGQKYNEVRYNALNLHSWIYRGTVECRIHHGTVGKSNLVNWARLWVAIVDYAYNATEADIVALGQAARVNLPHGGALTPIISPLHILKIVAPHLAGWMDTRIARFDDGRTTEEPEYLSEDTDDDDDDE